MDKRFYQKNGLTVYALSCGYVQQTTIKGVRLELYKELGCYHIRAFNDGSRLFWESFYRIGEARVCWRNKVRELKI